MKLPRPSGTVSVRASNVTIRRPAGVAFNEERFGAVGGEVDSRSLDYEGAIDRYDIAVTGGANAVTVGAW